MRDRIATREDLRRAAGQLICCGFEGTSVTAELREVLREVQPLGLILFKRNIESAEQVAELNRELKMLPSDTPRLLCVDQEGGRVTRIPAPATAWPTMREIGHATDEKDSLAYRIGQAMGRELRALSFDVDFAPVLDVDTNPNNPVIGDRSLSSDPEVVARLGTEIALGLHAGGVAAVGKHFPGHGDTDEDSHHTLPHLEVELPRLREVEWLPFRRAIEAGLEAIMTAHLLVPAIDEHTPATFSPEVLRHLRGELSFRGIIITDDLDMRAVADRYAPDQMAVRGLHAGVDLFLTDAAPERVIELYRGIVQGNERKEISNHQLMGAAERTSAWRDRAWRPPSDPAEIVEWVGCAEHQDLAAEVRLYFERG